MEDRKHLMGLTIYFTQAALGSVPVNRESYRFKRGKCRWLLKYVSGSKDNNVKRFVYAASSSTTETLIIFLR